MDITNVLSDQQVQPSFGNYILFAPILKKKEFTWFLKWLSNFIHYQVTLEEISSD